MSKVFPFAFDYVCGQSHAPSYPIPASKIIQPVECRIGGGMQVFISFAWFYCSDFFLTSSSSSSSLSALTWRCQLGISASITFREHTKTQVLYDFRMTNLKLAAPHFYPPPIRPNWVLLPFPEYLLPSKCNWSSACSSLLPPPKKKNEEKKLLCVLKNSFAFYMFIRRW